MAKETITKYGYWGVEFENKPTDFAQGLWMWVVIWMLVVIVFFPIWIWFWFGYKIIQAIGKLNGKPKKVEYEEEEYSYY